MRRTIGPFAVGLVTLAASTVGHATPTFHIDTTNVGRAVPREMYGGNVEFIGANSPTMQRVLTGMPFARFPGGDDGSRFLWSDTSVGTCSEPKWNWDAIATFAASHDMSLLLESNVVRGDAASTAAWVRDAISRGIRVPYVDVGNEVWGSWDAGYRTPAQYSVDVHATAAAVRAVSPTTRIVLEIGTFNEESWNREAIHLTADVIDAVDFHYYPNHLSTPDALSVAAGSENIAPLMTRIRAMIHDEAPARADSIQIIVGEYDGAQDPPSGGSLTAGHAYLQWSMPNALFYGSAIGEMLNAGVSAATYYELQGYRFGAVNGGACSSYDVAIRRPKELALELYRDHFGDRLLTVDATGVPTYQTSGPTNWDGFAGPAPYVRSYASLGAADDSLRLVIVNRDPDNSRTTQWQIDGFDPATAASAWQVAGDSMLATNENVGGAPDAVHITSDTVSIAGPSFTFEAPAHSVTALVIPRRAAVTPPSPVDASTIVDAGGTTTHAPDATVAPDTRDASSADVTISDASHRADTDAPIASQSGSSGCTTMPGRSRSGTLLAFAALLGYAASRKRERTV